MTALPIPAAALEDAGIVLGRRGAGKSNVMTLLLEHELDAGHRSVMIDPKGDRYGIRLNPDRTPSRFTLPVIGGAHGDCAVEAGQGEALGRLVATSDLSCLIDLSLLSLGDKQSFMLGFAPALLHHNRAPLTLFIEEVDQFANQDPRYQPPLLVHHIANFATLGRQRGIVPWVASQRPARVNATVRSQADTFIAMKVLSPLDRAAFSDWFRGHSKEAAARLEAEVGGLAKGEALVFAAEADFFERVQFPMASTFDSGRTPKHGEIVEGVVLPKIDLGELAILLAPAETSIPVNLTDIVQRNSRRGDAELIAHLQAENAKLIIANAEVADTFVGYLDREARAAALIEQAAAILREHPRGEPNVDGERLGGAAAPVHRADRAPGGRPAGRGGRHQGRLRGGEGDRVRHQDDEGDRPPAPDGKAGAARGRGTARHLQDGARPGGLNGAAEKAVALLARVAPASLTAHQAATLCGYKTSGGYWRAAMRQLTDGGHVMLLPGDRLASIASGDGQSREDTLAMWAEILPSPADRMIDQLGPRDLGLHDLADALGYQTSGGYFRAGLRALRDAGVITEEGGRIALASPLPGETA